MTYNASCTGMEGELEIESNEDAEEAVPTKVVSTEMIVNVRAKVANFRFDGLSDGHSIQTILAKVAPRHLIITHGAPEVILLLQQKIATGLEACLYCQHPNTCSTGKASSGYCMCCSS